MGISALPTSPTQDLGTDSLTCRPAKTRMWMDAQLPRPPQVLIEAQAFNLMMDTIKDMLMSLQSLLITDLSSLFHKISTDMRSMGHRVTTIKTGITECTTMVNDLIDTDEEVKEEQEWVWFKLADLED